MTTAKHVVLGLSGGVDSAVAALLLQEQAYKITAVFMKNWEEDDTEEHCSAEEDLKEVKAVCAHLNLPLKTVNFSAEYWDRVFENFLQEYRAGRTPNPDILCNKEIKFRAFLDYALELGADFIATGHYAGVRKTGEKYELLRSHDENKDQTYFLYTLGQHELSHSLFPLIDLDKKEVRELARRSGLPNYDRKDSTGICFIGERQFKTFLERYLPAHPGKIMSLEGETLGRHDGLMYYTIGQRQGLGVGGPGRPWYVTNKDMESNVLYVVQGEDHPALFHHGLVAAQLHWVSGTAPNLPLSCLARTRHRQNLLPCLIEAISDDKLSVSFESPVRAITPGQSVVFYNEETCLGGGIIEDSVAEQNSVNAASK